MIMKAIVTHFSPDLDAICSVWLIKRFLPNWENAKIFFVCAGETLNGMLVDKDPDIIHVDTGLGKFDHHQTQQDTCAAKKVLKFIEKKLKIEDEALQRIVSVTNSIDHFRQVYWPDPDADYHYFNIVSIIDGLKLVSPSNDHGLVNFGCELLDAVYRNFKNVIWAKKEIVEKGVEFDTKWGKGFACETINDEVMSLGQKLGYTVVVRRDPRSHILRIKVLPDKNINLSKVYKRLLKLDPNASWFLHINKAILMNGSNKNPKVRPTRLSLQEVVSVLKKYL